MSKVIWIPLWMVEEFEEYFLSQRETYIKNPTEAKLEDLEFIQEERRIQDPSKRVVVH